MIPPGSRLTVEIEKPAAGGRMLARHNGQIVLAWGGIPGERVRVRVERATKSVLYADTVEVLSASPDRRAAEPDWRCGGNVLVHVAYPRQLTLKGEIIQDAFGRIGRVPLPSVPAMVGSPERGYRMRARLHARGARLGFYREGTHDLCPVEPTGQLLPETVAWLSSIEAELQRQDLIGLTALEFTENIAASERAAQVEVHQGVDPSRFAALVTEGQSVSDVVHLRDGDPSSALRLRRNVRSFFQGNRFLLERLVRHVAAQVTPGPLVDLYAGVGLFGLSLAAGGASEVTLVEGDRSSGADLLLNAEPLIEQVRIHRASVEAYLHATPPASAPVTFIVDPPRTGMSKEALEGIVRHAPSRIVYVSCDVATLARDTRTLLDAGYRLGDITGFDLFPNTAHVESVVVFDNERT
jgi:23S rRNA (uracil1939-C5)-methyltransferase